MQYTLLKQLKRNESYRLYAQDNLRMRGLVRSTDDRKRVSVRANKYSTII